MKPAKSAKTAPDILAIASHSLRHNKLVAVALVVLAVILFSAIISDLVAPFEPYKTEIALRNSPPMRTANLSWSPAGFHPTGSRKES